MARFKTQYRAIASAFFLVLVLIWFRGSSPTEIVDLSMSVASPPSGVILKAGSQVEFQLHFKGGVVRSIDCSNQSVSDVQGNKATLILDVPKQQGLWVLPCEAISVSGSKHVFKPAYLVGFAQGTQQPGDHFDAASGTLVLPSAFFRPGCSNFLPVMEEALNTKVIPGVEKAFGADRRVLVDDKYLGLFNALVHFWSFRAGVVSLEMGTAKPNGIVVEAMMNDLAAEGHARFEISPLSKLPNWARKFTDLNFDGRLSGQGKIRGVFDLSVDKNGLIRSSLRPGSFQAMFHHFCFDSICFELESKADIQRTITKRMRAMFDSRTTKQLDGALNQAMARAELKIPVFEHVETAELIPRSFSVLKNDSLSLAWELRFKDDLPKGFSSLTWAGAPPIWQSTRPHLLISDRVFNQLLSRVWYRKLRAGVPDEWLKSINKGMRASGYHVDWIRLENPPVLAPGVERDGLRLILSDLRVQIRNPGEPARRLRIHAELPVRLVPSADHQKVALVGAFWASDLRESRADLSRDDGVVHLECLEAETLAGSESCSADTRRFQKLIDVALVMAKGLRSQIEIPLIGPHVPGPGGQTQELKINRVQLTPGAPGWLVLEADY